MWLLEELVAFFSEWTVADWVLATYMAAVLGLWVVGILLLWGSVNG